MPDLLLVVPSRGRPESVRRLMEAMRDTCRADTKLLVGLDDDDPAKLAYFNVAKDLAGSLDFEWELVVRPDLRGVVPWLNHLAVERAGDCRFIGTIGDDNVPRTDGWDLRVTEALERVPFCFGDDLYPGRPTGTLCCHVFMRSAIVKTLGYMGPPALKHMYVDPAWMAWGEAVGIEFLPDVVLEHMHYSAGKSEMDESYAASTALIPEDLDRFNAYCADPEGLNADIARLRGIPWSEEQIGQFKADLNIPEHWPA